MDEKNCGRPTLPLEHDIIPPFKSSIDNIRADYFNVFLLRNISQHSTSTNTSAGWIRREKSNALWVHLTLAVCYLPFSGVTVVILIQGLQLSGRSTCRMFSLPTLVDESSSLLLENHGNSKSSEGIFLLVLDLICIHVCVTKVKSLDKSCFTRSLKSISDHVRFKGRRLKKFIL